MSRTIYAREMIHWGDDRSRTLLAWMITEGVNPRQCASLTLEDDGTYTVVQFVVTPDGRRQIDPQDNRQALTMVLNFTAGTTCPEPISTD